MSSYWELHHRRPRKIFGCSATTQQSVLDRFAKFRIINFNLINDPRCRPQSQADNDVLKVFVESYPTQSAYELLIKFGVSKQTILKLDKWVHHELKEKQKQKLLEACLMLDSI